MSKLLMPKILELAELTAESKIEIALTTNFLCLRYWNWQSSQHGGPECFLADTSSHFCHMQGKITDQKLQDIFLT